MSYWFMCNSANGSIGSSHSNYSPMVEVQNEDGTISQQFDPNLIQSGFTVLGPFDSLDETQQPVFDNPSLYLYQDGQFIDNPKAGEIQLQNAKSSKVSEMTLAYTSELNDKFSSSATGTELVYDFRLVNDYGQNSQDLWKELKDTIGTSVDGGILPDALLFPDNGAMDITIRDNSRVPHTRDQLYQVFKDIATHKLSLYTKWQKIVTTDGDIDKCQSIDDVGKISW